MLQYNLSQKTIQTFLKDYSEFIHKEYDNRILMKCILPSHQDTRRSAVLYKDTGIYNCAVCGSLHVSKIMSGVEMEPSPYSSKKRAYTPIYMPQGKDYILSDTALHMVNRNASGDIVGHSWRITTAHGRLYGAEGEVGFRLHAPVMCESSTDAVALLEAGINAGSIQSVNNWKLVQPHQIFILQYDKAGIACANKVKGIVYRWENEGVKDIRELSPEGFSELLYNLNKFRV